MPKGGARTRSGPPPDPNALARDRDKGEWKILSRQTGRRRKAPAWPLPDDVRALAGIEFMERQAVEVRDAWANAENDRTAKALAKQLEKVERDIAEAKAVLAQREEMELSLWADLWQLPQALMWERQSQHWEVALYARRMIEAQERGSKVNLSTLVRQMADSLGLTTPGLRANRWQIEAEPAKQQTASTPTRRRARDRLTVVPGGSG